MEITNIKIVGQNIDFSVDFFFHFGRRYTEKLFEDLIMSLSGSEV